MPVFKMTAIKMFTILLLSALTGNICSPVTSYDTIVVGLGSAGTTAASTLARAGRRVLALEAQERVGGRVWTRPFEDGIVEAGAEWIHGQDNSRVHELAVQNNISVLIQDFNMKVLQSDGSGSSDFLTDLLATCLEYVEEQSNVNESMGELITRKLRKYLEEKNPAFLNDTEAFNSFLNLMNYMVGSIEASYDWNEVSALKGFETLGGSQTASWHRHGYKTFFEILLNKYNNGPGLPTLDVKLNKEVTRIEWPQQSSGNVVVTCKDGEQYSAPNVIVTVSLGILKERYSNLFSPPLPQEKISAIQTVSIGVVDKIILQFENPWPLIDSIMFYWKPEDKKQIADEDKWITRVLGTHVPLGSSNALTFWIVGDTAKLVETLPVNLVKEKVVGLLQRFVGTNFTVPQPVDIIRTTWYSNPFTRGSYSFDSLEAAARPGVRDVLAAPLLDAAGTPRVLFAGEATSNVHYSTVHGASETGYREAQRLLGASKN